MDPTVASGAVSTGLQTSAYGAMAAGGGGGGGGEGLDDGQQPSFTFYDLPSAAEGLLSGYDDALQGRSTLAMFQPSHAIDPHDRAQPKQQHQQSSRFEPDTVLMLHTSNPRRDSCESATSVGSGSVCGGGRKRATATRPGCDWEGSGSGHAAFGMQHGMADPGCLASALGVALMRNSGMQLPKRRPGAPRPAPPSTAAPSTSSVTARSPQTNSLPANARSGSPLSSTEDSSSAARKLNAKRAEQNRTAQRAFRERRGKYIKELEEKSLKLDRMEDNLHRTSAHLAEAEGAVHRLSLERGAWIRERELWWRERDEAIRVANTLARELEISQREAEKLREMVCGFWKDAKNGDEEGLRGVLWALARDARTEGEASEASAEGGGPSAEGGDASGEAAAVAAVAVASAEVLAEEAGQHQGHPRTEPVPPFFNTYRDHDIAPRLHISPWQIPDETFALKCFSRAAQTSSIGGGMVGCTPSTHPAYLATIAHEHSQAVAAAVVAHALGCDDGARAGTADLAGVSREDSSISDAIPAFKPSFAGKEQMNGSIASSTPATRAQDPSYAS
ncbi:hypothetical protein BDK51DRAFT_43709 [Blyttiomyces helicus]|uniref:BZIP domain-containing protein n=1 Tax=Blyttiomyces helicus TaxID=388810 RepID=A0A4P9WF45_9FUNG|nr:hypothetical protein BDK51DRAFT_43709 [Blyttiomyces helicus]|eukprot:RKO91359.1 hypothetical protein BDK51DRAFT_43709 [Blyttiomyces helicus]